MEGSTPIKAREPKKGKSSTAFIRDHIRRCEFSDLLWKKFHEFNNNPPDVATDSLEYRVWKAQADGFEWAADEVDEDLLQSVQSLPYVLEHMGGHEKWIADEGSGMSLRYCLPTFGLCLKPISLTCQDAEKLEELCMECRRKREEQRKSRAKTRCHKKSK